MKTSKVTKYITENNPAWRWPYQFIKGVGFQVYKRTVAKPLTTKLFNGKRIRLYPDCPISSQFMYTPIPDKREIDVLRKHAKGATFIDIGANIGGYSVMLSDVVSNIIAFEPDETSFHRLKDNVTLSGTLAHIEQMAVSNYIGQGQFSKTKAKPTNRLLSPHEEGVLVQVTTLDHYADKYQLPLESKYILKIDVEGEELQTLKGAKFFLQTYDITGILLESFPEQFIKVKAYLEDLGFKIEKIEHHNYWATQQ